MKTQFFIILFSILYSYGNAQKLTAKVDINMEGRNATEVNEPGYTQWYINRVHTASITVSGVTFSLTATGPTITSTFRTGWSKALVQNPYYSRLVNDGVKVDNDSMLAHPGMGAGIEFKISGLTVGKHSLQTYHNIWEDTTTINYCPMNVYVNNVLVHDTIKRTIKVISPSNATILLTELNVTEPGQEMVLRFEPVMNFVPVAGKKADYNLVLNAFELNTDDASKQACEPYPGDGDLHANADTGSLNLTWKPAINGYTQSHTLYFGLDSASVANATTSDLNICKGNFNYNTREYSVNNLYNMNTYYWRVDQTDSSDITSKGKIWKFKPRHDAFPGAEGYGRYAIGGRGGKVVYVTNLNDGGPGSFRYAVENIDGPRTILFAVSGIITLSDRVVVNDNFVTVAGQSAPGKGVCFRWAPIGLTGNDVIAQNLRVRVGIGVTYDGMGLTGANNSIVDHSSISWTIDEGFSSRNAKNITLQRTLISEALNCAGHDKYAAGAQHGFAGSILGDIGSFHHNLLAHCNGRNWSIAGILDGNGVIAGRMDIFNMVVYNWGGRTTDGFCKELNFVNNYYKPGAASTKKITLLVDNENFPGYQKYYVAGNYMPGYGDDNTSQKTYSFSNTFLDSLRSAPIFESHASIHSARDAYKLVLSDVGCTQPVFDDHDIRVVNETLSGTVSCNGSLTGKPGLPDHENDVNSWETYPGFLRAANWDTDLDGLPDWWENALGLNPNSASGDFSESNADVDKNGYTNLEEYLHWMSIPHYFLKSGETKDIDLSIYTRGFTNNPKYTVSDAEKGEVTLAPNSSKVKYNSTSEGLGGFTFTVTDADGTTMSQKIGVYSGNMPKDSSFSYSYYKDRAGTQLVTIGTVTSNEIIKQNLPIIISPNPVKNILKVQFNSNITTSTVISILDITGNTMINEKRKILKGDNSLNIDVNKLTPGVYFLNIRNDGLNRMVRFVKF